MVLFFLLHLLKIPKACLLADDQNLLGDLSYLLAELHKGILYRKWTDFMKSMKCFCIF